MRRRRISVGQVAFVTLNSLFLSLAVAMCFYPFLYIIVSSLNDPTDLLRGPVYFWPRKFSVINFNYVLRDPEIVRAIWVTVARTVIGTVAGVLFTAAFAYGISKKRLWGRKVILGMTLVTIYFSGGLIPTYLLIAHGLHLWGNFLVFIIPNMFNAFFAFIMMSFFREISPEIEESALMDGATEIRVFVQLILPLSTAVLATIALFFGVWHWNSWFDAMLYGGRKLMTLQQYLVKAIQSVNVSVRSANFRSESVSSQSLRLATMVLTTFPIVAIYPFLQRYFVKGVMIGSLKG
ncbi:MAG: carbohydrate ABC transporter permease [Spirochaetes bacterium]|nr:carbohydrate ABC transporter permease [Spirochaetota bacterium]